MTEHDAKRLPKKGCTTQVREYGGGIAVCWSADANVAEFCDTLKRQASRLAASGIFLYYSGSIYSPEQLSSRLASLPDDVLFCGCSTSGEVSPLGLVENSIVGILLPAEHFTLTTTVLENIDSLGMDEILLRVHDLKATLLEKTGSSDFTDVFAISLIDGLSYSEEAATAALHRGLEDIPLVGGSAGDDLLFENTSQIHRGQSYSNSAVLALVKSNLPFQLFTHNNYVPTSAKLVVTESDPDQRNVKEFDAEPAAVVYARAIGLDPELLTTNSFASHPIVVKVGGEYYCRSIQKCEEDNSMTFFCAIDDGIVLTIAQPTEILSTTREAIEKLDESLGGVNMILGFDCILRRLDAKNRGVTAQMSALYSEKNVIGFATYGEQFNSMHINQTLTGIAFGHPVETKHSLV